MMDIINVVYVKNLSQHNQLVLDTFVACVMLCLLFPENLKITWPLMTRCRLMTKLSKFVLFLHFKSIVLLLGYYCRFTF
jgi:hypothetical protein